MTQWPIYVHKSWNDLNDQNDLDYPDYSNDLNDQNDLNYPDYSNNPDDSNSPSYLNDPND